MKPGTKIIGSKRASSGKHVLLALNHGISIRYLLQTGIYARMKEQLDKITLLVPEKNSYLESLARDSNVELKVVDSGIPRAYYQRSWWQKVLRQVRLCTYGGKVTTGRIFREYYIIDAVRTYGKNNYKGKLDLVLQYLTIMLLIALASRSKMVRRLILWLEGYFFPSCYEDIIKEAGPDIVVTTSMGTFDWDQYVLRAAKRAGIRTVAVILSWDNTTTRGYKGAHTDNVVVWSEIMKREVIDYHDMEDHQVFVGGVALFDEYYKASSSGNGRALLKSKMGVDENKHIIFFATKSPNGYPWNPNIVEIIARAINEGKIENSQLVVRVHPLHYKRANGGYLYQDVIDAYRRLEEEYNGIVVINEPEIGDGGIDYVMPEEEISLLAELISNSSVIVNIVSTLNIEGSILDRPLVNVYFEGKKKFYHFEEKARFNIVSDYKATHNQRIVDYGGIAIAYSAAQLVEKIVDYLKDRKSVV